MPLKRQKPESVGNVSSAAPTPSFEYLSSRFENLKKRVDAEQHFLLIHQFADLKDFRQNYFAMIRRSLEHQNETQRFSIEPLFELREFTIPRVGSQCDSCFRRVSEDFLQDVDCVMDELAELTTSTQIPDKFEISESFSNFEEEKHEKEKVNNALFDIEENSSFDIVKPIIESKPNFTSDEPIFEVTPLHQIIDPGAESPILALGNLGTQNAYITSDSSELADHEHVLYRQPMSAKVLNAVSHGSQREIHEIQYGNDDFANKSVKISDFGRIDFAILELDDSGHRRSVDKLKRGEPQQRGLKSAETSVRADGQTRKVKGILKREK